MLVLLPIGFYTSRIILSALGVSDYGVYNVVGGFVSLFSIVSHSMSNAISRFITYELGRGDVEGSRSVFATSSLVLIALSAIVVLLTETVGLWFLYQKMVIPEDRLFAAFCVFQLSVISFVIGLIAVPYNAAVVAHEEMGKFATFSIVECIAKLIIVVIVSYADCDRLILYASLLCIVSWFMRYLYITYCKRHYEECIYHYSFDKMLFRRIFSFAGWSAIGSTATILRQQGTAIVLNLFGGPIVNAASGVALTLTGVVEGFVQNFTTAFFPQITKSYAAKDYKRLNELLYIFTRLSFYMMLLFALPFFMNTSLILHIWLDIVPDHSISFVRLVLIFILIETISQPIITAKHATGDIRNYHIIVGSIGLLALPISYLALRAGAPVEYVYVTNIFISIIAFFARMWMIRGLIPDWSSIHFVRTVLSRVLVVTFSSFFLVSLIYSFISDVYIRLIVSSLSSCIVVFVMSYLFGFSREERTSVFSHLYPIVKKFWH